MLNIESCSFHLSKTAAIQQKHAGFVKKFLRKSRLIRQEAGNKKTNTVYKITRFAAACFNIFPKEVSLFKRVGRSPTVRGDDYRLGNSRKAFSMV
ncbi:hypothetical protein J26TS2_16090 [Shouchella clausii]|nr:hypothetical protein J26TS2_16090 [Shouchella clausii]